MLNQAGAQPTSEDTDQLCPQCQSTIPVYRGYVTWCDHCGWNIQPHKPWPPRNFYEAQYVSIGKRLGRRLFEQLSRSSSLNPRLTPATAMAFVVAGLVHGLTLVLAITSVSLLIGGWPDPFAITGALFFALVAWLLRPRVGRFDEEDKQRILARQDFPALYRLTDAVAESLNTSKVDTILVDEAFNAAIFQVGWRRTKGLVLGLPLLSVLNGPETVALLGHEYAHGVNGDQGRGFFIGSALYSLLRWYRRLTLKGVKGRVPSVMFVVVVMPILLGVLLYIGLTGLWVMAFDYVFAHAYFTMAYLIIMTFFSRFWIMLLAHLLWQNDQREEYLADALGAQVAGTGSMLSMLEKSHLDKTFDLIVQRFSLANRKRDLFEELRRQVSVVPEREFERIRRVENLLASKLYATHPPTAYRVDLLRSHPVSQPRLVIPPSDFEEIQRELKSLEPKIQLELLESYDPVVY